MEPFSLAMLLMVVGMVGIEGERSEATRLGRRKEREREGVGGFNAHPSQVLYDFEYFVRFILHAHVT